MKIGILVLSVGLAGRCHQYNAQEVGLGRMLGHMGQKVIVYKCVPRRIPFEEEILDKNLIIRYQPVASVGNNALTNVGWLDTNLDILVCFSDIQLSFAKVYQWCRQNHIRLLPYVGIAKSTSPSTLIRWLVSINARQVYRIYARTGVLAKTNAVRHALQKQGVENCRVAPVGLDLNLVRDDFEETPVESVRKKYGIPRGDKLLLMVGKLEEYRNPLDCVYILEKLYQRNKNYRLLVVGKGRLKEKLFHAFREKRLDERVQYIEQVPNTQMWELYRMSDALVSFSRTEIFGMAILESMYYKTPVFAISAPGPNDIIQNGTSGFLLSSPGEMVDAVLKWDVEHIGENAHNRVLSDFSWKTTSEMIMSYLKPSERRSKKTGELGAVKDATL